MQLLEMNLGSTYGNISIAPAPTDIAWQNMKSSAYLFTYYSSFACLFLLISTVALSPVVFAHKVKNFFLEHLLVYHLLVFDIENMEKGVRDFYEMASTLTLSVLYFTFSLLTPYFVKVLRCKDSFKSSHVAFQLMIVRFGTWNKEKMISQYIIVCFTWVFGITILFPFYQVALL